MTGTAGIVRLSEAHLAAIATSQLDRETLDVLQRGQLTKRRVLLLALRRAIGSGPSEMDDAIALLDRVGAARPDVVDDLIGHPLIDAWASRSLADPARADLALLRATAATAAVRSGLDFTLSVPVTGGELFLPGLGRLTGVAGEHATIRSDGLDVEVVGRGSKTTLGGPNWQPARSLSIEDGWALAIEDLHPYRDCYGHQPAPRLDDGTYAAVANQLRAAWQLIRDEHPGDALVLRHSLRVLVPLAPPKIERSYLSASSQLAYGSVALLLPDNPATLAMLLIHEAAHMTLYGVLDVEDLYRPGGAARHHAPWRLDPRPIGALLQGVYAHLGVARFWRRQRLRETGPARVRAEFEFAIWRELTGQAVRALACSGELTTAGEHFVSGLSSTVDELGTDEVPVDVATAARDVADADAVAWRLRNQTPAAGSVATLALARRLGQRRPSMPPAVVAPREATPARWRGLAAAIRDRLLEPALTNASASHAAFLEGDLDRAAAEYRWRVAANPEDEGAWVGLALVRLRRAEPNARVLAERPDLVRALCAETGVADPVPLAA